MYMSHIYLFTYLCTHADTAPVTTGMATVTFNGLECGVTYTIIAGGTLNGDLVGPRSSHGTVTADDCPCPPIVTTTTIITTSMIGKGGILYKVMLVCNYDISISLNLSYTNMYFVYSF